MHCVIILVSDANDSYISAKYILAVHESIAASDFADINIIITQSFTLQYRTTLDIYNSVYLIGSAGSVLCIDNAKQVKCIYWHCTIRTNEIRIILNV